MWPCEQSDDNREWGALRWGRNCGWDPEGTGGTGGDEGMAWAYVSNVLVMLTHHFENVSYWSNLSATHSSPSGTLLEIFASVPEFSSVGNCPI